MSDSLRPHGPQPTRLLCPWDTPGQSTGGGCHFLLQGIFLTQGSNTRLCTPPALRAGSSAPAQRGSPSDQHITSTASPWATPELQLTANIQNLQYFIYKFRVLTLALIRRSDYSKLLFSPRERKPTAVFPLAGICFLITCP